MADLTPSSGAISLSQIRDDVSLTTGQHSMSDVNNIYNATNTTSISFSDLHNSKGYRITIGVQAGKAGTRIGWITSVTGSFTTGTQQIAANSKLYHTVTQDSVAGLAPGIHVRDDGDGTANINASYQGQDITKATTRHNDAAPNTSNPQIYTNITSNSSSNTSCGAFGFGGGTSGQISRLVITF